MKPPPGFVRKLKLIDKSFRPVWGVRGQRWMIVSDPPEHLNNKIKMPKIMQKLGYVVEYLVEQNGEYAPLDDRTLLALRMAMWEKNNTDVVSLDKYLDRIDYEEQLRAEGISKEALLNLKDGNKMIDRLMRTKTFS